MHKVYRTRGFIFKKSDVLDADRMFSVFSQDFGRIEIFAKAVRRIASKLKGGMDIFYLSDMEFVQGKNKKTLTDAVLFQKFKQIIEIPEKSEIAHKVSELLDHFIKGPQLDENMWSLIINFFEKLNSASSLTANYQLAYYYFFWNFISVLGYKPELFKCAHCNQALQPENLYFSNKEGGIVCQACTSLNKNTKKINADTVKILRLFLKQDWQTSFKLKINSASLMLLKEVSDHYYDYLNYSLKSNMVS